MDDTPDHTKGDPAKGDPKTLRITRAEAMELATGVLTRHGFSEDEAATIANHLVEAELRGHHTTGLIRLIPLVRMAKSRQLMRVVREGPAFVHVDGGGNPGSLSAEFTMRLAIDKARQHSFALAALFNSAQGNISGHYVRLAAEAGFVGILLSSTHGSVAPHGGIDPLIGTNPMAFAFPGKERAVVIDAATSALTNGDVEVARRAGASLPEGAALDADGAPTRVPEEVAALLPIAGHKGYAFGLALQLLGILAGGDALPKYLGNFGFVFLVIDPALFGPAEDFLDRSETLRQAIKTSRRAPGVDEILLPGERSDRRRDKNLREGMPIAPATLDELRRL